MRAIAAFFSTCLSIHNDQPGIVVIGIERLTDEELDEIRKRCEARARVLRNVADEAEAAANDKAHAAADRAAS